MKIHNLIIIILITLSVTNLYAGKSFLTDKDITIKLEEQGIDVDELWEKYFLDPIYDNNLEWSLIDYENKKEKISEEAKDVIRKALVDIQNNLSKTKIDEKLKVAINRYFSEESFWTRVKSGDEYILSRPAIAIDKNEDGTYKTFENWAQSSKQFKEKNPDEEVSDEAPPCDNSNLLTKIKAVALIALVASANIYSGYKLSQQTKSARAKEDSDPSVSTPDECSNTDFLRGGIKNKKSGVVGLIGIKEHNYPSGHCYPVTYCDHQTINVNVIEEFSHQKNIHNYLQVIKRVAGELCKENIKIPSEINIKIIPYGTASDSSYNKLRNTIFIGEKNMDDFFARTYQCRAEKESESGFIRNCEDPILAHEFGHAIFYLNMYNKALRSIDNDLIITSSLPHNELFADLIAVMEARDLSVIAKNFYLMDSSSKYSTERDFAHFINPYDYPKYNEEHTALTPSRGFLGEKILKPLLSTNSPWGPTINKVISVIKEDIFEITEEVVKNVDDRDLNNNFIKRLKKAFLLSTSTDNDNSQHPK
ncbi:MAG: hypothetical protein HQK51_01525 [Oligoflexia bacterium]|nr:hypothetical protein [Oligoflexia bacterium]